MLCGAWSAGECEQMHVLAGSLQYALEWVSARRCTSTSVLQLTAGGLRHNRQASGHQFCGLNHVLQGIAAAVRAAVEAAECEHLDGAAVEQVDWAEQGRAVGRTQVCLAAKAHAANPYLLHNCSMASWLPHVVHEAGAVGTIRHHGNAAKAVLAPLLPAVHKQ